MPDENIFNRILKGLPKMDKILNDTLVASFPKEAIKYTAGKVLGDCRKAGACPSYDEIINQIETECHRLLSGSMPPVINATGIVIHTNLGRAPLGNNILLEAINGLSGYCAIEYDIISGSRGDRYNHCGELLRAITGAEDAIIVNNNAAAVFLTANTFSKGKETIVSRGELVEIGGKFRIPDVIASSGAVLREIGTTNKTYASDYEKAVSESTGLILKVERSNYSISGFTAEVPWNEIPAIGKRYGVPSYYDAGCCLFEAIEGIKAPIASDAVSAGFDVISFSGDKLLGSVQCGIILGKKNLLEMMKKNPTIRMLRPDKLTLAVLGAALKAYISGRGDTLPVIKMLKEKPEILKKRAEDLRNAIGSDICRVIECSCPAGGGSSPESLLPGYAVEIFGLDGERLIKILRKGQPAVIPLIKDGKVALALRSVGEEELDTLKQAVLKAIEERNRQMIVDMLPKVIQNG